VGNSHMTEIDCSFCHASFTNDGAKGKIVAGAKVFICRDCVDICIQVFAMDQHWREAKISELTQMTDTADRS
jgi:ATP-dependent protease Clp ATPase subunit